MEGVRRLDACAAQGDRSVDDKLLDLVVVKSQFLQLLPLDTGSVLCLHAIGQTRLVVKPEVAGLIHAFESPRRVADALADLGIAGEADRARYLPVVSSLVQNGFLFAGGPDEERSKYISILSQWYGRDPEAARQASIRSTSRHVPRFAAPVARDVDSFAAAGRRLDVVMVGLCDVQIEMDVLRAAARPLGIDLHPVPTFETTLDLLADTPHDAVIVGSLGARHGHWNLADGGGDFWPERYGRTARNLLLAIRALTGVPVLINNLPVPTCSPHGLTDRGPDSPIERCRRINRELVDIAAEFPDVYVVDVDAALSFEGKRRLLDDRVMTTSHLGGLGWWTMLPQAELKSVHGIRPPVERLSELGVADAFEFDRVVAAEQASLLAAVFGIGRRDGVVVAIDGTLWPGELTVTGSPFPASVDFGTWSYHGFFMGVCEALRGLLERGIRLAGITRGDEASVRGRWRYPGRTPIDRLLLPNDFAVLRFGVTDVVDAVRDIARELESTPPAMVLVAAEGADRDAARRAFPAMLVLGDNPFAVRGALLTDASLQVVSPVQEGVEHPDIMVALARREKARKSAPDPERFVASLGIRCVIGRGVAPADLDRVHELVTRTRQFTTTGRAFTPDELHVMDDAPGQRLYTLRVTDQFADYGLVGVAIALGPIVEQFLLSCRVVGLGVDAVFLRAVVEDLVTDFPAVRGRLLTLARNAAARGVYRASGFRLVEPGMWEIDREGAAALGPLPAHIEVVRVDRPERAGKEGSDRKLAADR